MSLSLDQSPVHSARDKIKVEVSKMAASNGVTFRKAKVEDYQAVMDINRDVYTGMDHLPYTYTEYINSPFRFAAVGEFNGKVVS